jgi:light-regulated signal transduction histidine kinase (bacteriophytochrome)
MLGETCSGSLSDQSKHYLQRIEDGTYRMGMLVDDLLNLTRIGRHELKVEVTSLEFIVRDVIADLTLDTVGREIEWKIGRLPSVHADPALLKVVFQNLLANAVKYTRTRPKAIIEIAYEKGAVYVRDNGVGFDMKYAISYLAPFNGCIAVKISKAPASAWPSCSAWYRSTAVVFGRRLNSTKARAFI